MKPMWNGNSHRDASFIGIRASKVVVSFRYGQNFRATRALIRENCDPSCLRLTVTSIPPATVRFCRHRSETPVPLRGSHGRYKCELREADLRKQMLPPPFSSSDQSLSKIYSSRAIEQTVCTAVIE